MRIRYDSPNALTALASSNDELALIAMPVLGGPRFESFPVPDCDPETIGAFTLWNAPELSLGIAQITVGVGAIPDMARKLYDQLFEITRESHLYRIWNYLPQINEGVGDKERYRQFCVGRSESFHNAFGRDEFTHMPAGTCVGVDGDVVTVLFLAGQKKPTHHENPNQVPAYRYPRKYGPQAPSFARATSVTIGSHSYRFVSGTASVLGHDSFGHDDIAKQVEITCDNLATINAQTLTDTPKSTRATGKVFLRHADDFVVAQTILRDRFPVLEESFTYLRSDICRSELLVEIEISFCDDVS